MRKQNNSHKVHIKYRANSLIKGLEYDIILDTILYFKVTFMKEFFIMKDLKFFNKFYIDKEKDIQVHLFKSKDADELVYYVKTPYHKTGNLMRNLAAICNVETVKDENDMLTIKGVIPASINGDNEEVYIFRLGGMKIANIYKKQGDTDNEKEILKKAIGNCSKNDEFKNHLARIQGSDPRMVQRHKEIYCKQIRQLSSANGLTLLQAARAQITYNSQMAPLAQQIAQAIPCLAQD